MNLVKDVSQEDSTEFLAEGALSDDEASFGELFDLAAASFGFDGQQVLAKLAAADSIAAAAAIPEEFLEFLYARAHKWFAAGQFSRAEQVFQTLCLMDVKSPDYWGGLGLCLAKRSAWNEALLVFDKAVELKPEWSAMHFYRLEVLVHLEDWPRASDQYEQFLARAEGDGSQDLVARAAKYQQLIAFRLTQSNNGESVS